MHWKTSLRVPSLALGQSYDCPSASEGTLKDVDNIDHYKTTTKQQSMNCIFLISIYHMRGPYPVKWNLLMMSTIITKYYIDGLMHERHTSNSIANSLELRLSCTNPSICSMTTTNSPNRSDWFTKTPYTSSSQVFHRQHFGEKQLCQDICMHVRGIYYMQGKWPVFCILWEGWESHAHRPSLHSCGHWLLWLNTCKHKFQTEAQLQAHPPAGH